MPLFGKDYKKLYNELKIDLDNRKNRLSHIEKEKKKLQKLNEVSTYENHILKKKLETSLINRELMSKEELNNLDIQRPSFQRPVNQCHVEDLIISITQTPYFIVPIYLGVWNDKYYVLDGQHRLAAISKIDNFTEKLIVKVLKFNSLKELEDTFKIINNRLDLSKLVIDELLPSDNEEEIKKRKQMIYNTFSYFQKEYKYYFKNKKKILHRPFIDCNEFQDFLDEKEIIQKNNIQNWKELKQLIENLNVKYHCDYANKHHSEVRGLKKIRNQDKKFYLGIEKEWYNDLLINTTDREEQEEIIPDPHRIAIPSELREKVWKTYAGNVRVSKCICCDDPLPILNIIFLYNFFLI